MKNISQKTLLLIIISFLIIPQVTFAAWWNPLTWKIFQRSAEIKIEEVVTPPTPVVETGQSKSKIDPQAIEIEKLRKEVETLKKQSVPPQTSQKQAVPTATTNNTESPKTVTPPSVNITPPNTISCNGKYWNPCSTGQRFYCPTTGDAQCLLDNTSDQSNVSQSQQQLTQETMSKIASIGSSMSILTQLENNCSKSMKDSETETERLRGLLGGSDHYDILREIRIQESYRSLLLDECVSKQIRIIDNLLVDIRAVLRIQNLPVPFSSLMNQFSDTLILKRNRLVNWQFQYP